MRGSHINRRHIGITAIALATCSLQPPRAAAVVVTNAEQMAEAYFALQPVALPVALNLEEAAAWQETFVHVITDRMGSVAGYKAALTNPLAQERFGVTSPILGTLTSGMIMAPDSTLSVRAGVHLVAEGDLVVRVGSERINEAASPWQALASLDAVMAFLELPDLLFDTNAPPTAAMLVAANAGARFGVLGNPVPLHHSDEDAEGLLTIRVRLLDQSGTVLAEGGSSALLGHPLQSVLWIRDAVRRRGLDLHPGDLLSLGTITPPVAVKPGSTLTAEYSNLAPGGPVSISVTLVP